MSIISSTHAASLTALAFTMLAMSGARADPPSPTFVTMVPGETPTEAVYASQVRAQATRLRAQWLAAHGAQAAPAAAQAGPVLVSGKVVSSTITIGSATAFPSLSFTFRTSNVGFSSAKFVFVSPNGAATYQAQFAEPAYVTAATISFVYPVQLNAWSQPGDWTLQSAALLDNAGNITNYNSAQLVKLFPSAAIRVINNGPADSTPPKILAGNIVSENISMAQRLPLLKASLKATDAVSGFDLAYVFVQPPGVFYSLGQLNYAPLPLYSGSMPANNNLRSIENNVGIPPSGPWTITGYSLCDAAGNCAQSTGSSDVQNLFGTTTFNVTQ